MSTIEEVRIAEKKVKKLLDEIKKTDTHEPNRLGAELINATDEFARAVRELNLR